MRSDPIASDRPPRRLPKLAPMAAAAAAGVVVAEAMPDVCASMWCWAMAAAVAWFGHGASPHALLVATVCSFGLVHSLDRAGRESFPLAERRMEGGRMEARLVGIVADTPVKAARGLRFPVVAESIGDESGDWRTRSVLVIDWRLRADRESELPACGDRVVLNGWLAWPEAARNPGQFDTAKWLMRQGVVATMDVSRCHISQAAAARPLQRLALRAREYLSTAITHGLDRFPDEAAIIRAMVMGAREDMSDAVDDAFVHSGTLHIFSVSGLHVGFVALILWRVLNLLRFRRRTAAWVSIPLVFFYALVTGWQPAAVRSAVMAAVLLLGIGLDRPPAFFNSLCLAGLLLLAHDTKQLFLPGAQLSFVVIAAIAAGSQSVARLLRAWGEPDPFLPRVLWSPPCRWALFTWTWMSNLLAVSLVAGLASTPLTLWYFQLATPISLVANMIHVPLAACILCSAGLSAVAYPWFSGISSIFTHANAAFARCCLVTAGWFSSCPGGSVKWNPRLLAEPAGACRIIVLDVGHGGAVLIRTPRGKSWLLDSGDRVDFRTTVAPALDYFGVRRLDGLILSHGDHEHVGAAADVIEAFQPRFIGHAAHPMRSPGWQAALQRAGARAMPLQSGDRIELDEQTTVDVLWPPLNASVPVADDGCLVLRLEIAGTSALFTNDAGFLAEDFILRSAARSSCNVWVRGRHATDLSGLPDFVERINPSVVVCANQPPLVHSPPAEDWRHGLLAGGAEVIDQSVSGAVSITISSHGGLSFNRFLKPVEARSF